ncbi:hypothetical protein EG328_008811 [Venturia inaequalis]|uniref:AMP-dependent synthetase/ligase domain-containing protein n=1 Tax=Venturia inaequalis TaxID=5025 RepID=A0A8H3UBN7_VENIN|nr:hypothetical protein EG328_008811 [Venturia inaequalis]
MPLPTDRNTNLNGIDRLKCIFPYSSKTPDATGRGSIHASPCDLGITSSESTVPARLKAAWILTLQCFIIADVFCFEYNDCVADNDASMDQDRDQATLYVTRLHRSEPVQSFITRFEQKQRTLVATKVPESCEISTVASGSLYHQCNTSLYYRTNARKEISCQKMDLAILVTKSLESKLVMELDYSLSHTDAEMAQSILSTFQHIYTQILNASATLLIHNVDPCPPSHRKRIQEFTNNVSPVNKKCLHDLIIDQCRQRPDQIAVRSWDGDLTYGELDDLSMRLASHVVELGVRPETFVLSCFEKSTLAIIARLAILRAGGAYISIHASNPPVYLESVIIRTKTTILLTDSYFVDHFRGIVPTVVELAPKWLRSLPKALNDPVCEDVQPDNACLVLFTSGSTGTPKGIIQIHSSYATAIQDYARNLHLGSHTRYLSFDDYAFDISNLEFLVPLIMGGVCCVPGPMKTVEDLASQIRILDANIVFLTPTVAIKLEPADVPCLEIMCVGGEPLPKDLVRKWAAQSTRLVNQYGMGEVAICCAYNDQIHHLEGSKIGRPSSGAIWIVDPASTETLLPIGGVGELIIEGPHLSRGYIDSTALGRTEAGFLKVIPRWLSQLHPDRAHRMYRSGDLGRLSADGKITYLGRKDTILKLDGCRIDALEVEHQVRKFLSDKDSIVVDLLDTIDGQADPSLTAFLYLDNHPLSTAPVVKGAPVLYDAMSDGDARAKVEEIKNGLALALPRYMIPSTYVLMTWTPRTASKKLDRKKVKVLGQAFYSGVLEEMTKDKDYAHRMKLLPM